MKFYIHLIFIFFMLASFQSLQAQNLIPNGSFEDTVSCPVGTGQIYKCEHWIRVTFGSPDYFHPCSGICGVPDNTFGNQQPQDGSAYAGINLGAPNLNYREYMSCSLIDSLKSDSCYHFEMYISLGNFNMTTYNIQVFLSDTFYQDLTYNNILLVTPQIQNPPGNTFDTLNWTLVTGDYMAQGGEKYIIIGNFYSTSMATYDTLYNFGTSVYAAYVYLDNVSLMPTVCTSVNNLETINEFSVYPNPASDFVTMEAIRNDDYKIVIYDALSRQVTQSDFSKKATINLQQFPSGFYTYFIMNAKGNIKSGKLIIL